MDNRHHVAATESWAKIQPEQHDPPRAGRNYRRLAGVKA